MIKKTYKFVASTRYVGSEIEDEVEIEFTEEEYNDENMREKIVEEYFQDWLWENLNICWEELED